MTQVRMWIAWLLNIYFYILIGRLILDWIQVFARSWRPKGVVLVVAEFVYTLTDPPIKAVRRVIPPLRLGGVALDLGFLVVLLGVQLLIVLLSS